MTVKEIENNSRWNKPELNDEKSKTNESLFKGEFLCEPPPSEYCHDFDKRHYFIKNKCELCGIRYNKFRELMERRYE